MVARVLGAHGVRGELRCQIVTDFPERFRTTRCVFVGHTPEPFIVRRARIRGNVVLLALDGIDTPERAAALRGEEVLVARGDSVKLAPGRFYWHEVLGVEVRDEEGRVLGPVVEIIETGANDVYVVQTTAGELLIPAIREVIKLIDPAGGQMTVHLLPGLGRGTG